mgnify:CR=1 FL=1|tara:strand:- start:17931 stop:18176 length:246 start_codon:yes stop_codon:yes gene_type:complete
MKTRQQKGGCKIGDKGGKKGCKVGKKAPRRETKKDHGVKRNKTDDDDSKDYMPKKKGMTKPKTKPFKVKPKNRMERTKKKY